MIEPHDFVAALGPVRTLVQADGGDLVVVDVGSTEVRLRLVLADADCADCVMPRSFLERVALDMLQRELPGLATLTIDDPREVSDDDH